MNRFMAAYSILGCLHPSPQWLTLCLERSEASDMMHVNFACVLLHGFGHCPDILAPGPQEAGPEEDIRGEFNIIPCPSANIVAPVVTGEVVVVHDIAIIPEAVP